MKKHYPWLWFDADGTLFNYNRAEATALLNAFQALDMRFDDGYLDIYRRINDQHQQSFERREITLTDMRVRRFEVLLEAIDRNGSPELLNNAYLEQLAICTDLIEGAYEVLDALRGTCQFAIVTNGSPAVQRNRLANSTIKDYISELIISEEIGIAKPQYAFFDAAFARTRDPDKSDVLIIGDSLTSDIRGGVDYGIDTCWFNPNADPRPGDLPITYEIAHLSELLEVVN